jgi:hypothetical protein
MTAAFVALGAIKSDLSRLGIGEVAEQFTSLALAGLAAAKPRAARRPRHRQIHRQAARL